MNASPENLPDDEGVDMRGESGAEVARNLQRLAVGLVAIESLGPNYMRTPTGYGVRIKPGTFPIDQVPVSPPFEE